MNEKLLFKESVRGIVEYVLKSGSLDDRFVSRGRAVDGTIAHGKLQKDNALVYEDYEKEVKLQYEFKRENIILLVEGRADGIIKEKDNIIIEEIKSTYMDLSYLYEDYNLLHWAQGKFYGYIYCINNHIKNITIRLSYFNLNTDEVRSFDHVYTIEELEVFVYELVNKYLETLSLKEEFKDKRDKSIKELKFPFKTYRKGQRELAVSCYSNIRKKGILFAQAPTGIGKTISTIFPAIKGIGEGRGEKIIYLTAKTITRTVAEEAYIKLFKKDLKFRVVTITAKEKICLNDEVKCNPDDCIYAKDYFSKINDVINDLIKSNNKFFRNEIIKYAKEYKVCPFELSLDLSNWCDGVICDYNYAFDPRVRLKRIFEDRNEDNILLIDEAHNLVNRAREMYSCTLEKSKVMVVNKVIKGKVPNLYKISNSINKEMIHIRRELEEINKSFKYHNEQYKDLIKLLRAFINEADSYLVKSKGTDGYEEVLDFYYEARNFIAASELYDKEYTTILKSNKNEFTIKIFCINPAKNLRQVLKSAYSSIIFSATLSPVKYYVDLIGGDEESFKLRFDSPFNKENLSTYLYPLDMRYVNREKNTDILCNVINNFINEKKGNYMVFMPSFEYLNKVYARYIEMYGEEGTIVQEENLTEIKKEKFLDNFNEGNNITGFTVVGGMFSEGVDLPGDKLIGAIIVGVGFPMVSIENNIISEYFEANGFDYSYTYPGINKVLQSVGRVIRTEYDTGRILLIDRRYSSTKYKLILPKEWEIKDYKFKCKK